MGLVLLSEAEAAAAVATWRCKAAEVQTAVISETESSHSVRLEGIHTTLVLSEKGRGSDEGGTKEVLQAGYSGSGDEEEAEEDGNFRRGCIR